MLACGQQSVGASKCPKSACKGSECLLLTSCDLFRQTYLNADYLCSRLAEELAAEESSAGRVTALKLRGQVVVTEQLFNAPPAAFFILQV